MARHTADRQEVTNSTRPCVFLNAWFNTWLCRYLRDDPSLCNTALTGTHLRKTVREWQFHAKQIAAGKNFEGTGPFGPWMVTADEIEPGRHLKLETRLNGEVVQSSDTGHLIFSIPRLIAYASTIFTLVPGDVIITGTPAGVGFGRKPPSYMKAGDVVEVEIEAIGTLRNTVVMQE